MVRGIVATPGAENRYEVDIVSAWPSVNFVMAFSVGRSAVDD
jgi:hypothetical protein